MTPEGKVKAEVKKLLKLYAAWSFMPVSAGYGAHGIPDIIACYRGVFIAIECKAPGKRTNVTPLQIRQLTGISEAGGLALIVADPSDLEALETVLLHIKERGEDAKRNQNSE